MIEEQKIRCPCCKCIFKISLEKTDIQECNNCGSKLCKTDKYCPACKIKIK